MFSLMGLSDRNKNRVSHLTLKARDVTNDKHSEFKSRCGNNGRKVTLLPLIA